MSEDICLVGISHRTSTVEERERFAVRPEDCVQCLRDLEQTPEVREVVILSTCNRTEVLISADPGFDALSTIRTRVFRNAEDESLYVYRDIQAVIHLFRLGAGLDSQVLGESEILRQLKMALEFANEAGTSKKIIGALYTQALRVGKRVRTETDLGKGTLSIARVGIHVAQHVFGKLDRIACLVVGAGETGALVAKHLQSEGVTQLTIANRTQTRAEELARELNCRGTGLDQLKEELVRADLVVACVDGERPLIDETLMNARELSLRDRPLLAIDLSIPRAISESVAIMPGLLSYDLDALNPIVAKNQEGRDAAIELSTEILVSEVHKFLALRTFASFSPAITTLRERFDEIRESVLDSVTEASATGREMKLAHSLTKRLLGVALEQMKEGARRTRSEQALDREYRRFLEEQ
ncbi:MAG: glutamyl-tRNA reductase [Planctomycetota bacterium]|jgi:glutamyl-tRNA reductase